MDEMAIYKVYVGLLRAHKGFYGKHPDITEKEHFSTYLNKITCECAPQFCNQMRKIIWNWFLDGFSSVGEAEIANYYSDLWHYHRQHINAEMSDDDWVKAVSESEGLCRKYNYEYCHKMIREIILQIDDRCKQQVGA